MLLLSERLRQIPILSLQTGSPLAHTASPIIDPRRLNIVAFYCEGPLLDENPSVLHTADIREYSDIGIIVNGNEDLMPPDDLVRLQEIIDFKFELIGIRVIDDHKTKLGKVIDYVVDAQSFMIQKITVKPPLIRSIKESELVIDRHQIVEITDECIVVKAPSVTQDSGTPHDVTFHNPFRKHGPQIEG
ncbi:hypothetical protein CYG49_04995 [Candidatus Saccharibacteria bacterium]|nr:MAG: hypothetical protein CYG49_04995 [Candidatus Saccharibacteria bacterium]